MGKLEQPDPAVFGRAVPGCCGRDEFPCSIAAAIVDDDDFPGGDKGRQRLPQAVDAGSDAGFLVVRRYDDGQKRLIQTGAVYGVLTDPAKSLRLLTFNS
jgi:hypothetical protein